VTIADVSNKTMLYTVAHDAKAHGFTSFLVYNPPHETKIGGSDEVHECPPMGSYLVNMM
jgi:hypothetical protein